MTMGTDPNRVILTGENPYIRLGASADGEVTTRTSFWRVLVSPGGPGHVLFITSELTGNQPRVYSDNIAVARWFQRELVGVQYEPFADQNLEVIEAEFDTDGDVRSFWNETISSEDDLITMTWYDIAEPYIINHPPNSRPGRPHGVYACMIPAGGARLTLNGQSASGRTFLSSEHPGTQNVSSLAFSESWLLPR
jgi:hypothetical protein